jgi:hypothetical protein
VPQGAPVRSRTGIQFYRIPSQVFPTNIPSILSGVQNSQSNSLSVLGCDPYHQLSLHHVKERPHPFMFAIYNLNLDFVAFLS